MELFWFIVIAIIVAIVGIQTFQILLGIIIYLFVGIISGIVWLIGAIVDKVKGK